MRPRRPRATAKPILPCRPNDEFANFERWDFGNLDGSVAKTPRHAWSSSTPVRRCGMD